MLREVSSNAAFFMADHLTAIPFALVFTILMGVGYVSYVSYRLEKR